MASVTIRVEDTGRGQIGIEVESDPHLPLRNGDLDVDRSTPAQGAARLAVGEIVGEAMAGVILTHYTCDSEGETVTAIDSRDVEPLVEAARKVVNVHPPARYDHLEELREALATFEDDLPAPQKEEG